VNAYGESSDPGTGKALVEIADSVSHPPENRDGTAVSLSQRVRFPLAFALAALLSAAYMFSCYRTGWLPQDDGTLAQAAYRVMQGQLPHRDFVENYTGGLSYLHAGGFRIFGINLLSLRICLLFFFLAWVPAVFLVLCRFVPPVAAAAATVLAVVWSVPNYPASMPSWYNLFFATFGAAALLRYLDRNGRRWLFVAGLVGGLSFLIKVTALYYVAGVFLFMVFREQELSHTSEKERNRSSPGYNLFALAGLLAFLAALVWLMRSRFDDREFIHYLLPSATLATLLIWRNARICADGDRARFNTLFRMAWPFVLGVALPITLFLVPYVLSGSLPSFWSGVFGHAVNAAQDMSRQRPLPTSFVWCVFPLLALGATACWRRAAMPALTVVVSAGLLALLLVRSVPVWSLIWCSADFLMPAVVTLGAAILMCRPQFADGLTPLRGQQLMLLLSLAAVCNVVSFPFAAPIYLCYALPLTIFAAVGLISVRKRIDNAAIFVAILLFYAAFAVWRVEANAMYFDWMFVAPPPWHELQLPRAGGIRVDRPEMYASMVDLIRQHAGDGTVLATPECPEVYFLSGMRNPMRNDNGLRSDEILKAIQADGLKVVVINVRSTFAGKTLTPEVGRAILARFPHVVQLDRYWVLWRD